MNIPEELLNYIDYNHKTGQLFYTAKKKQSKHNIGDIVGSKRKDGRLSFGFTIGGLLKTFAVHRVVWFIFYKEQPPEFIDHINRNPSDNRVENLRQASRRENSWNTGKKKANTSGYIGVTKYETKNGFKWRAGLRNQSGKRFWKCGFDSPKEASIYYNNYVKNTRGSFGVINE